MLEQIVNMYKQYPLALTGCRARSKDLAYDVCEYNILLLEDTSISSNALQHYDNPYANYEGNAINKRLDRQAGSGSSINSSSSSSRSSNSKSDEYIYMDDGSIARMHRISSRSSKTVERVMLLDGMVILNDVNSRLSMLEANIASIARRVKISRARSLMVDAFFYASNAMHVSDALEASFWLRSAACSYMEAHILSNGSIPMPSHILAQMRMLSDINTSTITECLGLEHANRSSVARAMRALMHILAASNYSSRLAMAVVRKKVEYLSSMGMYTDAYAYICYICREFVKSKGISIGYLERIPEYDMLSIAMNLSSDHLHTSRLADKLVALCKARLNAY